MKVNMETKYLIIETNAKIRKFIKVQSGDVTFVAKDNIELIILLSNLGNPFKILQEFEEEMESKSGVQSGMGARMAKLA